MENGQALVEIIIPNPVVFAALEYSLKLIGLGLVPGKADH